MNVVAGLLGEHLEASCGQKNPLGTRDDVLATYIGVYELRLTQTW